MGFNNPGPGRPRCPECGLYYPKGTKRCGWDGLSLEDRATAAKPAAAKRGD